MTGPTSFRQLTGPQRRILLWSVALLPPVDLALRIFGYYRLRRFAEWLTPVAANQNRPEEVSSMQRATEVARSVSIAARRGPFRATCLRRSLLVWWWLRRGGIQTSICFGVRTSAGKLEAHSWVEYSGAVLDDSTDVRNEYRLLHEVLPPTMSGL
jgi:hypothetical protein